MGAREFAAELRDTIQQIKADGTAAIYCDNLIAYLTDVATSAEKDPGPAELERYKAELQQAIDATKLNHEADMENFKAVITAGQNAIRTILLINGGAAVAILAFIGHLAGVNASKVPLMAASLLPFTYGVLAAGLISGGTYLSQFLFASPKPAIHIAGHVVNYIVIVLGVLAYILFGWGMVETYKALIL